MTLRKYNEELAKLSIFKQPPEECEWICHPKRHLTLPPGFVASSGTPRVGVKAVSASILERTKVCRTRYFKHREE